MALRRLTDNMQPYYMPYSTRVTDFQKSVLIYLSLTFRDFNLVTDILLVFIHNLR